MRKLLLNSLKLINNAGFVLNRKENFAFEDILAFFGNLDEEAKVIFDVGANRGGITEEFLGLFPDANIHTFEAIPDLVTFQRERFRNNDKVIINESAVSDRTGKIEFNVNIVEDTSSILNSDSEVIPERYGNVYKKKKSIEVNTVTLDSYYKKNKLQNIDLLKMDIQGAELMALEGSKEMLEKGKIKLLYLETLFIPLYKNQAIFTDVFSYLSKYNYSLAFMYNLNFNFRTGRLLHSDSVFIHNNYRDLYPKLNI